jgi:hypothetical protein
MIDFKYRALTAKIIDNGQYTEASAVVEAVRNKIHGPMLIDPVRFVHDHPEVADALLTFLKAKRKTFFLIQPFGTFVVNYASLPKQQSVQPGRTEFTPLFSKLTKA